MSSTPRLAFFVPTLAGGGAEKMMFHLASGFAARGYAVDLVLAQATGVYLERVPPAVRVIGLGAPRLRDNLPGTLARYLRREQPAALLATIHYANLAAIWARRLAGVPTRIVVREESHPSQRARMTPLRPGQLIVKAMPLLARLSYPHADGIVAVSQGVAVDLVGVTGLPPARIRVVYNPVILPDFAQRAAEPASHPWLAPGQPPVIVSVGRLSPPKDFATLLRAFAQVRAQRPVRLLLLGEGGERAALEALAGQLGLTSDDVALPGFVANPYPLLRQAALFALTSRREGLPSALIEALACGTPVVATDCPSGPAEILAGGSYGTLVPVGDHAALARALLATLDAPLPAETLRARAAFFSLDRALDSYTALLLPHEARPNDDR